MKRTSTANSAATTLVPQTPGDIGGLTPPPKFTPNGGRGRVEDYSDVEVDVTSAAAGIVNGEKEREKQRNSPAWEPGFLKEHGGEVQRRASLKGKERERELDNGSVGPTAPLRLTENPTPLSCRAPSSASRGLTNSSQKQSLLAPPSPNSLPATPSMIIASEGTNRARRIGGLRFSFDSQCHCRCLKYGPNPSKCWFDE